MSCLSESEEVILEKKIIEQLGNFDPAHDIYHVRRVVNIAKKMGEMYNADLRVIEVSAWLHDFINLPKDHPDRSMASTYSAKKAVEFLKAVNFQNIDLDKVYECIQSHSFSANIPPKHIEAKIIQDADRLDGLGAIGIFRLFTVGSKLGRDLESTLIHVEEKLRIVSKNMNTDWAKSEAQKRMQYIDDYILELRSEHE